MDDLLFSIIAVAAVAGFVLGILSGVWPILIAVLLLTGLFLWLTRKRG